MARAYKPEELFDENGTVIPELTAFMPTGELRIGANPNANGGRIREELKLPKLEDYEVKEVAEYGPGWGARGQTRRLGVYTRDIIKNIRGLLPHLRPGRDRFQPSEAAYDVTNKQWDAGYLSDRSTSTWLSPARSPSSCPSTRWKASSRATC